MKNKQSDEPSYNINKQDEKTNFNDEEIVNKKTVVDIFQEQEEVWLNKDLMPIGRNCRNL